MTNEQVPQAQQWIEKSDAVLIIVGDGGLTDYKTNEEFWKMYPTMKELDTYFSKILDSKWFANNPLLAWAFYSHKSDYNSNVILSDEFEMLLDLVKKKNNDYFIYTSNTNGEFQKAGFSEEKIVEVHGSIHHFQCLNNCKKDIWHGNNENIKIDIKKFKDFTLPLCKHCGGVSRPNIMVLGDCNWNKDRTSNQEDRFAMWYETVVAKKKRLAIIEITTGSKKPTIRNVSEHIVQGYNNAKIVRINPKEYSINQKYGFSIPFDAFNGLKKILFKIGKTTYKTTTLLEEDNIKNLWDITDYQKYYLLDATHDIKLANKNYLADIYIKLEILKEKSTVVYKLYFYTWSNKQGKAIPIVYSSLEESVKKSILNTYKPIIDNLIKILQSITTSSQLKELMYRLKHSTYIFHYKLLNMFTPQELERIFRHKSLYLKLNIPLLQASNKEHKLGNLFLPNYIDNIKANGVEIRVDLNTDDYPLVNVKGYHYSDRNMIKREIMNKILTVFHCNICAVVN